MAKKDSAVKKEFKNKVSSAIPDCDRVSDKIRSERMYRAMNTAAMLTLPEDDPLFYIAIPSNN